MRFGFVFLASLLTAASYSSAAKSPQRHQDYNGLSGWAARLSIPIELGPDQRLFQKETASRIHEEYGGSVSLLIAKYTLTRVYNWLFKSPEEVVEEIVEHISAWKDTAPRFVVYGDKYDAKSSLSLPDPLILQGVTHFLIPFWTTRDGITGSMLEWTQGNSAQRKAIVQEYNKYGIRLGMSAFFADTGRPNAMARRMAKFARKYQFQGVNVDYKDYNLFEQGNATAWLIPLARRLRSELPCQDGFFLSHAPIAPLFNSNNYSRSYSHIEEKIGEDIDFYSVQVDGSGAYTTCKTLIHEASEPHFQTALLQLHRIWNIPLDKLVIGRPTSIHDHDFNPGQMKAHTFARCLGEAFSEGWKGGVAWKHLDGSSIESVLQPMLDQVRHYHHQKGHTDRHNTNSPKHRRARYAARANERQLL